MLLFIVFWLPLSFLGYELLAHLFDLESSLPVRMCLLVLTGLIVPQSGRLKDAFLTPRAAKYFSLFQAIDEQTRLYVARIINREERKVNTSFMGKDRERRRRALDRVFEQHNLEIAREEAKKRRPPETALDICKIRHPAVKFKYLLHHLGYSECLRVLRAVSVKPEIILPTWPVDQGDRREGRSGPALGRRKYEQASVQAYVLDIAKIKKKYQVFISSTFLDLKEERQQALRGLLAAECIPAGMEFFPSSDEELWTLIRNVVDECDYYLLLIGGRYGSTTREGVSYTEAEYEYAVSSGKPVLAFLHTSPAPVPGVDEEGPDKKARLQAFKDKVCRAHAPGYWNSKEELPFLVQQAIEHMKRSSPGVGWIRYERAQG